MGLFDKIFKRGKTAPAKLAESIVTPEDEAHGAKRIAEYKSIRELGTGAEGYVMEMVHVPTGKHYAVKAVRRHGDRKPKDLELLQKLRHPNIIELHDWIMTKNTYYLVFELATGGELLERMVKRGHYTEVDAAAITATIFNAMAYVHAHDIVHRDLKTANLLFKNDDGNAELLIVDFGLARSTLDQQEDTKEDKQALLNTWKVGTQYYQAPEIVAKKPYYGKPADVFCLGQITYTLLSGVNPFWEAPPHELDKYVKQGKWTFHPRSFNKVSEEGKDFIKRCLETDPERRMTTDQAMRHPWIMKYCPPAYRAWLLEINEDLFEYEKLGLEEESKHFVESIKEHASDGEWTLGHAVSEEALPERPWRRGTTPPPPENAGLNMTPVPGKTTSPGPDGVAKVAPGVSEIAKPKAAKSPTEVLEPESPRSPAGLEKVDVVGALAAMESAAAEADGKQPEEKEDEEEEEGVAQTTTISRRRPTGELVEVPAVLITSGRRASSKLAYMDEKGEAKEIGVFSADQLPPPTTTSLNDVDSALSRKSIKGARKSSNMLYNGVELGVLDLGTAMCKEGHEPGNCACIEAPNLAPDMADSLIELKRTGSKDGATGRRESKAPELLTE